MRIRANRQQRSNSQTVARHVLGNVREESGGRKDLDGIGFGGRIARWGRPARGEKQGRKNQQSSKRKKIIFHGNHPY
jgi:hypothetical protein